MAIHMRHNPVRCRGKPRPYDQVGCPSARYLNSLGRIWKLFIEAVPARGYPKRRMRMDELDYHLPPELIARQPASPRDHSRLLVYRRGDKSIEHRHFYDLDTLLEPSDALVANNTRVIPARLEFRKSSGGRIVGLFIEEISPGHWRVMLKTRGRFTAGSRIEAVDSAGTATGDFATAIDRGSEPGQWIIEWENPEEHLTRLAHIGSPPLPPYIEKSRQQDHQSPLANSDVANYQTVYARVPGALAAPTAWLHFTQAVLSRIKEKGIRQCELTLHVGLGTFLPVKTTLLEQHPMHAEWFSIPAATTQVVRATRQSGGRIVAVGTTTVRSLEAAADSIFPASGTGCETSDISGATRLLISPGYKMRAVDVLITNFHLPRSTLLALVAAIISPEELRRVYQEAVTQHYRFYSFGDAMIIL